MKFFRYVLLVLVIGFVQVGCGDWLDVNDNPNTAEEIDAKYLFNYAVTYWSGSRCEDSYNPVALSSQTQADGNRDVFYGGDYDVASSAPYIWDRCYVTSGNNLQLALEQLKFEKVKQPNAEAQCKIALAMQLYEASMLFGDVPYSEAWDKTIKYPKFDSQRDVLEGVISMLDEALALIDVDDKNCIDDHDPLYKGNMKKWMKIANSLKFRTLMVMVDADPFKADIIKQMVEAGEMVASVDDNMEFKYSKSPGNENPKYILVTFLTGDTNLVFFAHNKVIDAMKKYDDSRIPRYFSPIPSGEYVGINTRDYWRDDANIQRASALNNLLFQADWSDLIYSYQEQLLLEAEVYARGLGGSLDLQKANDLYRMGVKVACDYYGADSQATQVFMANLPDLSKLTSEKAVYEIHLQQWIDLMDRPLEVFVQWRRSGAAGQEVPSLSIPPQASAPYLIRRWEYPSSEVNSNPNAPQMSPKLWEAMWFDL